MTTHIIAPEVDQAREYLLQTLLAGGFVEAFGFAAGSRAATPEAPVEEGQLSAEVDRPTTSLRVEGPK